MRSIKGLFLLSAGGLLTISLLCGALLSKYGYQLQSSLVDGLKMNLDLLRSGPAQSSGKKIENYRVVFEDCRRSDSDRDERLIAVRRFVSEGREYLLAVDPFSFRTSILEASSCISRPARIEDFADTPFVKDLLALTSSPSPLQDAGLNHAETDTQFPVLTVDLCPSHNHFEKQLFESLIKSSLKKPVPVAVSLSGLWMKQF